ncbi:hypothetical protein IL306_009489 [Fusarium sp. DS 682]|nr:hypothetical protein IL306_009489 [Fusarium sp. DS 682]
MSTPSGSTPSGASGTNTSTVSVAGSFPDSTKTRDGANQPNPYSIDRYVNDKQQRPINDRLAEHMAALEQEKPPKDK